MGDAELLGESAIVVVRVPIPGLCKDKPLRCLQTERVHIGDENQKARKALITADEFSGLLDRVDRVSAGVGKSNDLGFGRSGLQQKVGKIVPWEWMAHLTQDFAPSLQNHSLSIALQRVTEGIIGRDEEPRVTTSLDDRLAGSVCQRPRVVGPMDRIRRAILACQIGGCGAGYEENPILLLCDSVDH